MISKPSIFLAELKRRKVWRVAVVYAAAGLAVIEAANNILPELGLAWLSRTVVILVLLGCPIALLLAWALDITPKGIRRTEALEPDDVPAQTLGPRSLIRMALAAGVFVLLLGTSYWVLFRERGPRLNENRVAVMQFTNGTSDAELDVLGVMAAEWITDGLIRTGLVEVVPTAATLSAPEMGSDDAEGPNRLRRLAAGTGAGVVISGSYFLERDSLRFQAQVLDTRRQRVLGSVQTTRPSDRRIEAIEALREQVMGALAFHVDPRFAEMRRSTRPPPTYESYRAYAEQSDRFLRLSFREAITLGYRAFELDTTSVVPLLVSAAAHVNLGQFWKADSLVTEVARRRERLPPADRQILDYLRAFVRGDLSGVLTASRGWAEAAPGFGQALDNRAWASLIVNRPEEALEALRLIDLNWWSMRSWSRYWDHLTAANHMLGRHRRELREARRGREHFPEEPSGWENELRALAALGRVDEVERLVEASLMLSTGASDGVARVAALELRAHGQAEVAGEVLDRAVASHSGWLDPQSATASERYDLAETLYFAARWDEAEALFEDLAEQDPSRMDILGYLGVLAARKGDRDGARRISEQLSESEGPYAFGSHTYRRARVAAQLGERERAVTLLREAHAEGYQFGLSWHTDVDLEPLRSYPPFESFVRPNG